MEANEATTHELVLQALRRITRAIDLHSRSLIRSHGLTGPQLFVLRDLARREPVTVGKLAEQVNLSQPTVTGILSRLERRGLLSRERSRFDRRQVLVSVTDKGRRVAATSPSLLQERFLTEFEQLLDWEQSLILSSLQRVVAMLEARELDASPILATGPLSGAIGGSQDPEQDGASRDESRAAERDSRNREYPEEEVKR
ncbi:MAG: MarR family transcriptional regulator [Acidobacteriota bacterium]